MDKLTNKILNLEKISAALEPSLLDRNKMNNQLQDFINYFIETIDDSPAYYSGKPDTNKLSITLKK